MNEKRQKTDKRHSAMIRRLMKNRRLTPKERQSLVIVLGLFLLGMLVRWYRLAHLR